MKLPFCIINKLIKGVCVNSLTNIRYSSLGMDELR